MFLSKQLPGGLRHGLKRRESHEPFGKWWFIGIFRRFVRLSWMTVDFLNILEKCSISTNALTDLTRRVIVVIWESYFMKSKSSSVHWQLLMISWTTPMNLLRHSQATRPFVGFSDLRSCMSYILGYIQSLSETPSILLILLFCNSMVRSAFWRAD